MKTIFIFALIISSLAQAQDYDLAKIKVSYQVKHSFKTVDGICEVAKCKAVCSEKVCEFLAAIRIKDFKSGNTSRDTHMWKVTKAELFPWVIGRMKGKIADNSELNLEFAGKKRSVKIYQVKFKQDQGKMILDFNFDIKLSEFEIERPRLLTMPVEDRITLTVHSEWKR